LELYGGIAGLLFESGSKQKANEYGLFILGQGKKNIKIENSHVKPFKKQ